MGVSCNAGRKHMRQDRRAAGYLVGPHISIRSQ